MTRRPCLLLIACTLITAGTTAKSTAQEMSIDFQLLKMKPAVADALQKRLLEGGEAAAQADKKLPDLIQNRTVQLVEQLQLKAKDGTRVKADSGKKPLKLADGSIVEGLSVEVEPNLFEGAISLSYALDFAEKAPRREVLIRSIINNVQFATGTRAFLQRLREDNNDVLILTATVTPEDGNDQAIAESPSSVHGHATLYKLGSVDARDEILKSAENDPEAALKKLVDTGKEIESLGTVGQSGQRSRTKQYIFRLAGDWGHEDGSSFDSEFTAGADGRQVDMNCVFEFLQTNGKRARNAEGDRVDQRERIHAELKKMIASGSTHLFPCTSELLPAEGKGKEEAPYIVAISAKHHGKAKPAAANPPKPRRPLPAGGDPKALITRVYVVPPNFMRVMNDKFLKRQDARPTSKELLKAAGIPFPDGANAAFIADKSEVVLRNQHAAHQLFEALLENLD